MKLWKPRISPITRQRWERFKSVKRGYVSLILLVFLGFLCLLDNLLVGEKALIVRYQGETSFPVLGGFRAGTDFGLDYASAVNYRELKSKFAQEDDGNWVLLPPVPYSPLENYTNEPYGGFEERDGKLFPASAGEGAREYSGRAFLLGEDEEILAEYSIGLGAPRSVRIYNEAGRVAATYRYDREGNLIEGEDAPELARGVPPADQLVRPLNPPTPPNFSARHFLGTDQLGRDVLARLFGGMQIAFISSFLYLLATYLVGIALGCALGYFGGKFDLFVQRLIEIWSNIPFIFVVIIVVNLPYITSNLWVIVGLLVLFGWMSLTYYMRTATYKEKARDYVAAARVLGAGDARIVFKHILPNAVSTVVTFIPFTVTLVISSITALDFLGFGLPVPTPSWGELLKQGQDNMGSPWILLSAFTAMVSVLVLVTFVGEGVREAYDPKSQTAYR